MFVLRVEKIIVVLQPSIAAQLIRWFNPHRLRTAGILVSILGSPDRSDILHPHSRLSFGEKFLVCYCTCSSIGDAHLTEDGGGAQGPSEPQCLAGRTLGTWLPYRTSL